MNDNDIMPFGSYKGTQMISVPASYFLYLHRQGNISHAGVKEYIEDNLDVFQEEIKRERSSYAVHHNGDPEWSDENEKF